MRILIAEYSGYCYGVKRATQILDEIVATSAEKVYTLGPIIHNAQVTEFYAEKGVKIIDKIPDLPDNSNENTCVVVRSHGAPKVVYDSAASRGILLKDATCPYVKKIHKTVSEYASKGYRIVIVGDAEHPEVIGINGWCDNRATVVADIDAIASIEDKTQPVCVVAQTTFNLEKWQAIETVFQKTFQNVVIHNTICLATEQRQNACRTLAEKVDLMIVIGGKHSSNTTKLVKICSEKVRTIHIETKDDLKGSEWQDASTIGIAAGASTPDWIIQSVVLKIENEGEVFF